MKVGIIGSGLQCLRRASVLNDFNDKLVAIASKDYAKAIKVSEQFGAKAEKSWKDIIMNPDIDAVIVCTPPQSHAQISIMAMKNNKHVLVEKPLSKTISESIEMFKTSNKTKKILKCGFNHRHHPAIWNAKKLCEKGYLGKILFIRCKYGICGRPEYEKEWRASKFFSAGGQFIEQGSHGIDLIRWFAGEIYEVSCMTSQHYFKKQKLEDDGFALFRLKSGATASLHTSLVQWKNAFTFEVFGENGYLIIDGLGNSYGTQKLIQGKRNFNAPFQDKITYYRGPDISWKNEWKEFKKSILKNKSPLGNGYDGLQCMKIALSAYKANKLKKIIKI